MLLGSALGTFTSLWLLLPVVPMYAAEGGARAAGAGATTGVFMAFNVACQFCMPWLLGRYSHRAVLAVGCAFLGLPTFVFVVSNQLWLLCVVSALRGLGLGMAVVTGTALIAEILPPQLRGRGSGLYGLAVAVPNVVCLPVGVWGAQSAGYAPLFVAAGVAPLLGILCAIRISIPVRHWGEPAKSTSAPWRRLLGPGVIMLVGTMAGGVVVTFLPAALANSAARVPVDLLLFATGMAVCRWLAGVIGDHSGRPRLLPVATSGAMLGMALLVLATTAPAAGMTGAAGALLVGAGFGAIQNDVLVLMFDRAGSGHYATVSTLWNIAYGGGTGFGAFGVGAFADLVGFPPTFLVIAGLLLLTLPVAVAVRTNGGSGSIDESNRDRKNTNRPLAPPTASPTGNEG